MTRDEFKQVARDAIEQLTHRAEAVIGQTLPRSYCFSWLSGDDIIAEGDVAEFLVHLTFMDGTHISPCFDLFLESLRPDGRLLLRGYRAGYEPCAFGDHVTYRVCGHDAGRVGPFKLGMAHIIEQFQKKPWPSTALEPTPVTPVSPLSRLARFFRRGSAFGR